MAYPCYVCFEKEVTIEGEICGPCQIIVKAEDEAAKLRGDEDPGKRRFKGDGRGRGRIHSTRTLLRSQIRIYAGMQERLERRIKWTNRHGIPETGGERGLFGQTLMLGNRIATLVESVRKHEKDDAERAKKRTPAERAKASLAYLLSGRVTQEQRKVAILALQAALDGKAAPAWEAAFPAGIPHKKGDHAKANGAAAAATDKILEDDVP